LSLIKFDNIIIHGEIYGPGIQGDKYTYDKTQVEFIGFDIEIDGHYINHIDKLNIFGILGLDTVEVLHNGKYSSQLLTKWNNDLMKNEVPHEGVVISCPTGDRSKIMKVVSPLYLMKAEELNIPDSH